MTTSRLAIGIMAALLTTLPTSSHAHVILVPEEMSLSMAVEMAVEGDTLSLAPGTYERTPDPFIKSIVIEGRVPDDPPLLRRLEAGGVTLKNLRFQPESPGGDNPVLLRLLDSVTVLGCQFRGFGKTAILVQDNGSTHDWLLDVEACQFLDLNVGIQAELVRTGSRVLVSESTYENCFVGIRLETPARGCPAIPYTDPPPLGPGPAKVNVSGTSFSNMTQMAIDARNAAWALDVSGGTIETSPIGIQLERAGARIADLDLKGIDRSGTGILAISSRLEMITSRVYRFALGIDMTINGGCERPAGFIGGALPSYCRLDSNKLAIVTTHAVGADYNYWGTLDCSFAQELVQGITLRFLANDTGDALIDCLTPVVPATWSRIKASRTP